MKLSVIIVSYNVKYYLAQCLRSVEKAIGVLEYGQQGDASGDTAEILVVDNHSQDGTVEYLEQCFPASRYPISVLLPVRIITDLPVPTILLSARARAIWFFC